MPVATFTADITVASSQQANPLNVNGYSALDYPKLAARQALLSKTKLRKMHTELVGPSGLFAEFSIQVAEQGRQAPSLQSGSDSDQAAPPTLTDLAVEFALALQNRRPYIENPFAGFPREDLCCVVYDNSLPTHLAERYAANEELKASDSRFFVKLIATTRDTVERRLVFQGLLEHFDALLPIEQSIYQAGYREVQQSYLEREVKLYGALALAKPLSVLFTEQSPENVLASVGPCIRKRADD